MLESVREAGVLVCRRERHGVVVDERDCQSWSNDAASDVCVAAEKRTIGCSLQYEPSIPEIPRSCTVRGTWYLWKRTRLYKCNLVKYHMCRIIIILMSYATLQLLLLEHLPTVVQYCTWYILVRY
jgi:hypothetical protein